MIFLRKDGTEGYSITDTLPAGAIQVDLQGLPVIAGWPGAVTLAAGMPTAADLAAADLAAAAVKPAAPAASEVRFYRAADPALQAAQQRAAAARREAASEAARLESLASAEKNKK